MDARLRDCMRELRLNPGVHATVMIPRHSVHAKTFRLPGQDPVELRKMVAFRLQNDLPLPTKEFVFGYRVVGQDDRGYTTVRVVMAWRAEIERYLRLCKKAGLVVDAIRLNAEATFLTFQRLSPAFSELGWDCVALVDVDFSASNVLIIEGSGLRISRSVGQGISGLMHRMSEESPSVVFEEWVDELAVGVADTIRLFRREGTESHVGHLILSGWLPRVEEVTQRLKEQLHLPISRFDPTIPLRVFDEESRKALQNRWFSTSALLGLGDSVSQDLVDLRPPEELQIRRRRDMVRSGAMTGFLCLYLLGLFLALVQIGIGRRKAVAADLQARVTALQPQMERVARWRRVRQTLRKELGEREKTAVQIARLFEAIPRDVELSSLTFSRGRRMVIRGAGSKLEDLLTMTQRLSRQPSFGEATIGSADRRLRDGKEIIEFELTVGLATGTEPTQ